MPSSTPTRLVVTAALLSWALTATPAVALSQGRGHGAPPTAHGGGYGAHQDDSNRPRNGIGHGPGQEHLSEWMSRHSQLSPFDQQRALEHEPGFRELAPPVQQRMRDRLSQLDSMPPQRRQRLLDRTEAIERLAPEQRQQIRGSMQQLSSLPPDQRHAVAQAFRQYRSLSPQGRQDAVNSGRLAGPLSPGERSTLNNLITVEPYLPLPPPPRPPQYSPQP